MRGGPAGEAVAELVRDAHARQGTAAKGGLQDGGVAAGCDEGGRLGDEQGGGAVAERRVGDSGLGGSQGKGASPRRATGKRAAERRSDPRKAVVARRAAAAGAGVDRQLEERGARAEARAAARAERGVARGGDGGGNGERSGNAIEAACGLDAEDADGHGWCGAQTGRARGCGGGAWKG